jgi:hypothetical protein
MQHGCSADGMMLGDALCARTRLRTADCQRAVSNNRRTAYNRSEWQRNRWVAYALAGAAGGPHGVHGHRRNDSVRCTQHTTHTTYGKHAACSVNMHHAARNIHVPRAEFEPIAPWGT